MLSLVGQNSEVNYSSASTDPGLSLAFVAIFIVHSYGGGPGAVAAKDVRVDERRAAGRSGGIMGLICISASVAEEGQTLLSSGGGSSPPFVTQYVNQPVV